MKQDVSRLLNDSKQGFIGNIEPYQSKMELLYETRREVRKELRIRFQDLSNSFRKKGDKWVLDIKPDVGFLETKLRALDQDAYEVLANLTPKFAPQGSIVYKTMNKPCQPPQQMDLDDGIYLPIDMFEDKPVLSKDLFFKFVDGTLSDLARRKGWEFSDKKNTCSRVILGTDLHVDVPLYAIPRKRFVSMKVESLALESINASMDAAPEYVRLEPNEVNLALRNTEAWTVSDPKLLNEYFSQNFSYYKDMTGTHVCRRVCRYLKAWRDKAFKTGGPSSVALMTCVVLTFQELAAQDRLRKLTDSVALDECVKRLALQLRNGVPNDAEPNKNEKLFPKSNMLEQELEDIYQKAELLNSHVKAGLNASTASEAIANLQAVFGDRIPNIPSLVVTITVAEAIRSQPAIAQPQPNVANQDAG